MATIPKEVIAAAVAHGLSGKVASTWYPDLPRIPRVLVPVRVDALVVRTEGGTWADCRMRPPPDGATDPVPAFELLPPPFQNLEKPRPRGVYLHWAPPDALLRGAGSAETSSVSFPALPDRWLVLRLSDSASLSRRAVAGWVIEAGAKDAKVTPLDTWTEPGVAPTEVREPLNALGHGDPAWTAYFDNVANRFGFYDDLHDVARGPLAYLVCGWHSDPARDPLGESLHSVAQLEHRLAELGWELGPGELDKATRKSNRTIAAATLVGLETREARFMTGLAEAASQVQRGFMTAEELVKLDGITGAQKAMVDRHGLPEAGRYLMHEAWWPQQSLYHGSVVGIGWPTVGIPVAPNGLVSGEVGGPPPASSIKVAIGNTLTEALGAMVAFNNNSTQEARLLEAVLLGATDELDEPDGSARLDVRLHANGFGSLPGGETTETIMQRPPPVPPRPHRPNPRQTKPGVFETVVKGSRTVTGATTGTKATKTVEARTKGGPKSSTYVQAKVMTGGMRQMLNLLTTETAIPNFTERPATNDPAPVPVTVKRSLPRKFIPPDPVFVIQGAERSSKYQNDGAQSESHKLTCRITGHAVTELVPSAMAERLLQGAVTGDDVLERGVDHGAVPPECEELLRELALLDPGSATIAVRASVRDVARLPSDQVAELARTYAVEQVAWWVARDPRRDVAALSAKSGINGTLPAPIAVSAPVAPWVPLHLDWEVEYIPSPNGAKDWQITEVDFDARTGAVPPVGTSGRVLTGRALLSGGAARIAAGAVRRTMEQAQRAGGSVALEPGTIARFHSEMAETLLGEINGLTAGRREPTADDLEHLAEELERMDVLAGALDRFHTSLRGGFVGDGVTAPAAGTSPPADFVGLRAGFLRIRRLRLVDCFGQVLDLAGSSATQPADMSAIVRSEPLAVQGRPDVIELAPRFTSPSRLWFRFVSATDDAEEATGERSPLCGFVLPNHLDGDLQVYAADGTGLGAVRPQAGAGIVWEDAPGRPTTAGRSPLRAIENPHLGGLAQALIDWGIADTTPGAPGDETALSALLRIIDSTLWSVDPFSHTGEEHLSLLVAHPVAVMRAKIRLEVQEPVAPDAVAGVRVPVRIGALAHWQDGLLAYFVNDDYKTLRIPDPASARLARPIGPHQGFLQQATATSQYYKNFAADIGVTATDGATPVDHDYVEDEGVIWIQPNQDVWLTLLMEPHSVVHATSGLLPRKDIGMRREWVAPGLSKLAPTFRFGPVLVDPKRIRMPVASDIRGTWSWSHRVDPTTWADEPVVNSNGDAELPPDPSQGQEGWLKLTPPED